MYVTATVVRKEHQRRPEVSPRHSALSLLSALMSQEKHEMQNAAPSLHPSAKLQRAGNTNSNMETAQKPQTNELLNLIMCKRNFKELLELEQS